MRIHIKRLLFASYLFFAINVSHAEPVPGMGAKQKVSRGVFSSGIVDREPVDQILILSNDVKDIYFFTDLRHFNGQTITHRWEYEGKTISEKSFDVGGARWRVFSKRTLSPTMTGEWTVIVTDGNGWPVFAAKFEYVESTAGIDNSVILPPDY